MADFEINDVRDIKGFKNISFSGFKKSDVRKELLKNLKQSKIEQSCYWCAELICAGQYIEVFEIIIHFYSRYVHSGNPKLAVYLDLKFQNFKDILNNGYVGNELTMRNSSKIRKLYCEIICILCESKQKHSFDEIKIKKEDFDMTLMTERFKAPNIKFAEPYFKNNDPKELYIAINELSYNLSDYKNCVNACYWIEWILEFESICKLKKEKCACERRSDMQVDAKLQMDIVWLIWDVFLQESNKCNELIQKIIRSLLHIFALKYTTQCFKKRKFILYFVIELLTENVNLTGEIVNDKDKINGIVSKIDNIYKQIKKNEHSPNTEYLFKNVKSSNLEKTIEKLDKMNNFGESFTPRV